MLLDLGLVCCSAGVKEGGLRQMIRKVANDSFDIVGCCFCWVRSRGCNFWRRSDLRGSNDPMAGKEDKVSKT